MDKTEKSVIEQEDGELLSVEKKTKKIKHVNMKRAIILASIAVVVIAALIAGFVIWGKKDETKESTIVLYNHETAEITRIEAYIRDSNETLVLTPFMNGTTQEWNIEGQKYDNLNQTRLSEFVLFCAHMEALYEVDNTNFSEYGLDDPKSRFSIDFTDGTNLQVRIGDYYGAQEGTYAYIEGSDRIYVVSRTAGKYMTYQMSDLINLPSLTNTKLSAQSLFYIDTDRTVTRLSYIPGELSGAEEWYILEPTVSGTYSDNVDTYFENVSGFVLSSVYAEKAGEDLEQYGFTTPYCEFQSYDASGKLLDHLVIGKKIDDTTYLCALLTGEDETFADSPVYTVKAEQVANIKPDIVKLADPYLLSLNVYWLRGGEFKVNGKTYTLTIDRKPLYGDDGKPLLDEDGMESTQNTYYMNGKQLDDMQFKMFYSKVLFLSVEGSVSPQTEKGEELFSYSLSVSIPITDASTGESYVKDTVYTGVYYKISDTYAVFKSNESENAVFTVRCRSIENVAEALNLLMEGRMPVA